MKSGTSYLQHLCHTNRRRLREAGVLWPGTALNFAATQDLLGIAKAGAEQQGAWRTMDRKIRRFDGDVLISNEMLLAHREDQLRTLVEAVAPAEVQVIITARDLARVIPSQWQTAVRTGKTVTWSDFAESVLRGPELADDLSRRFWRHQDLKRALRLWKSLVPPDRVVFVTVPPSGSDPALFGDRFMSVLGIDGRQLEQPTYHNMSLGAHSAELVRRLNEDMVDWDWNSRRAAIMVALNSRVLEARASDEPRLSLSIAQHAAAAERAKLMVRYLKRSDAHVVGDLADLLPGDPPSGVPVDPAETSAADLLVAAHAGLVGLAKEYADLALRREKGREDEAGKSRFGRVREGVLSEAARRWSRARPGTAVRTIAGRVPGARKLYGRLRGSS
jgi:hypothetical protein